MPEKARSALIDLPVVSTFMLSLRSLSIATANERTDARLSFAGDFQTPGFVHDQTVPGTQVMTAKKAAIRYVFHPLPGGGEVRIVTRDAGAVTIHMQR